MEIQLMNIGLLIFLKKMGFKITRPIKCVVQKWTISEKMKEGFQRKFNSLKNYEYNKDIS